MNEITYERLKENLENLKLRNTLEILDNYLERAVKDKLNVVEVLDHLFSEEAKAKRRRAYEKQIQLSGFPGRKLLDTFDFPFRPPSTKGRLRSSLPCASWRMRRMWYFSARPVLARPIW